MPRPPLLLTLLAALTAGGLFASPAGAQYPTGNYTYDRAYRHFLESPSPYKTFSSLPSTHTWGYDSPYQSGRFWYTSPYRHEEMSYRGWEGYQTPAQTGGVIRQRPMLVVPASPYPPPGGYYSPYPGPVYARPW